MEFVKETCMAFSPMHCRCDIKKSLMIGCAETTYYPKAGCLRIQRRLYNIRSFCGCFGKHFWEMLVLNGGNGRNGGNGGNGLNRNNGTRISVFPFPRHETIYLSVNVRIQNETTGMMVPMMSTVGGIMLIVHVWRIQMAARRYIRRRFEARALAAAMAGHPRLGANSGLLAEIPSDVLAMISVMTIGSPRVTRRRSLGSR
jgi:hypothetical protein